MPSLTLHRARAIVEHAENEFGRGGRIDDAFVPFQDGGASSRTEARSALLIVVAESYRLTTSRASSPDVTRDAFESYARSSRFIATRVICDQLRDVTEIQRTAMRCGEDYEAFLAYLRTLEPKQADFWPRVYERLQLPCPTQPISFATIVKKLWPFSRIG